MKKIFFLLLLLIPSYTFASTSVECVRGEITSSGSAYYSEWVMYPIIFRDYSCWAYSVNYSDDYAPDRITIYDSGELILWTSSNPCWNAQYVSLERFTNGSWSMIPWWAQWWNLNIVWWLAKNCICPEWKTFWEDKLCHTPEELADARQAKIAQNQAYLIQQEETLRQKLQAQQAQADAESQAKAEANAQTQSGIQAIALRNAEVENQKTLIQELRTQNAQLSQLIFGSGRTNTGTLVSTIAQSRTGSVSTGSLSGTGSKTPIELLRERFYANQKARLEAHYAKLQAIREGFLKIQAQE